jgi:tartrate dehydrogenase/decarboxylase / D-malate dehydrogenase
MRHYRIAVLPGDGIGLESIQTLTTLDHVHGGFHLDIQRFTWGAERYLRAGAMMPLDGLTVLA